MRVHAVKRSATLSALVSLALVASAFFAFAPAASADYGDCPSQKICLWAGPTYGGQRAFFDASDTGWKSLANIDPRSVRNNTSNRHVYFPEWGATWGPGQSQNNLLPYWGWVYIY